MRTTVTLDPDVERVLQTAMRERGVPFKQALNDAIRAGLTRESSHRKRRFVQKTYSLGAEQHFRWEKALAASEAIEDEELSRRLTLRK
jgi:aspartate oxidase